MIWRMRIECWIPKARNTHLEYVIITVFFTVTMVVRTHLNVTYVHCLPSFQYFLIIDYSFIYFTSLFNGVGVVALKGTGAYRILYEL